MMIEKIILDYLNSVLDVPAYMEILQEPPESYVLIEKTSSSRTNYINAALFALQSYAPSLSKAAELNEQVKNAMDRITTLPDVSSSKLNNDYNFTDTTKKQYRYQAVYEVFY